MHGTTVKRREKKNAIDVFDDKFNQFVYLVKSSINPIVLNQGESKYGRFSWIYWTLKIYENKELFTCLFIIKPLSQEFLPMTVHCCISPDYCFGHRSMFLPFYCPKTCQVYFDCMNFSTNQLSKTMLICYKIKSHNSITYRVFFELEV